MVGPELPSAIVAGLAFVGRGGGAVKALGGFRKGRHTVPDAASAAARSGPWTTSFAISGSYSAGTRSPGSIAVSTRIPLPFVSEYPRLIRSLAFAYVWERWPDTKPDGGRTVIR